MANAIKTNAMRILERGKIPYQMHTYSPDGGIDGISVAAKAGLDLDLVYKTLVTQGKSQKFYVFVIPVAKELNLKSAASSVGEKNVEMIHVKDIEKITGYIRGGCSPVGMKKNFKTVIDFSAEKLSAMYVSGGKIGYQIEISPADLARVTNAEFKDITL